MTQTINTIPTETVEGLNHLTRESIVDTLTDAVTVAAPSDKLVTAALIKSVLDNWADNPTEEATRKALDFLESALETPSDINSHFLEYFAATDSTRAKAEEFLAKFGSDATHGDLREYLKTQQSITQ